MRIIVGIVVFSLLLASCKNKKNDSDTEQPVNTNNGPSLENTYGFNVLKKVRGIWNGPVSSTTALGNYPEWIVDFRPISENQISAKNELDTLNDIFMSFFIVKYNNQYKVAFRNGGSFGGMTRVSYFICDSVSEQSTQSFYRFAEIVKGKSRAYTDVICKSDSLSVLSYTNRYNTQTSSTPHMAWRARLQDTTSCESAVAAFAFPKKSLTKDFSDAFTGQSEAVYYNTSGEPYPETQQPYLGKTTVNYSFANGYTPNPSNKVMLVITTQPLLSGFSYNATNLKYRSRYVILNANDLSYTFNYMHPGTYYLYAFYNSDSNATPNNGDWMSATNTSFTLSPSSTQTVQTQINFTIP